jgi:cell wall-associated NlpC family hydrolase
MDCSSFTRHVYRHFGIKIARSSLDQSKQSTLLDVNNINKGNLVYFSINKNKISHVGIFIGNSRFIHSPGRGKYVRIDSLSNDYWKQHFVAGGKIVFQ